MYLLKYLMKKFHYTFRIFFSIIFFLILHKSRDKIKRSVIENIGILYSYCCYVALVVHN